MLGDKASTYAFSGDTIQPIIPYDAEAVGPGTTLWEYLSGLDWWDKEMTSEKTLPNHVRQSLPVFLSTDFLLMIFSTSLFYFPWQMIFQAAVYLPLSWMTSSLRQILTGVSCQQRALIYSYESSCGLLQSCSSSCFPCFCSWHDYLLYI